MTEDDPVIREIRAIRRKISEECGHDVHRLFEHYKKFEEELRREGRFKFYPTTEEVETKKVAEPKPKKLASKRRPK